eukprot:TRINITY_DN24689_c0_g2_i1.p1 TRINITY_DN24689_c0_g2~~TRINITY_DN24689_c0_g2_i1.p1  ORF type:complete len:354 (+),score=165.97 TRINITY_DN24689_c0_g2_i1:85-1146(+)
MMPTARAPEEQRSGGFFSKLMKKLEGCDIELQFKGKEQSDMIMVEDRHEYTRQKMHLFLGDEDVEGQIDLRPSGKLSHQGILIEFYGVITIIYDGKEEQHEFCRQEKKFQAEGGALSGPTPLAFKFNTTKEHDSYRGMTAKVQYFVRLTIKRSMKNITSRDEIWVSRVEEEYQGLPDRCLDPPYHRETDFSKGVGMEVGVDDKLHIEFKYDKKVFHIQERVVGQVGFKVARLDLHWGEVSLVRKEFLPTGNGSQPTFEQETLQKFEIMDGLPVPGEVVPIRLYLNSVPRITPSYLSVANKFSVKYFVNLVLVTGDGKRFFKQQEITLYRRRGQEAPVGMSIDPEKAVTKRTKQ